MFGKNRFLLSLALTVVVALLVGACSDNNNASSGSGNGGAAGPSAETSPSPGPSASPPAEPETSASAAEPAFPRTVSAFNGDITIEKKPERVALVHWGLSDALLTFELPSAAIALPFTEKQSVLHTDVYKPFVDNIGELKIVGENTEVNMEALLAYQPDLILAGSAINEKILADLPKIATTVVIDEAKTDVWNNWQEVVTRFGAALGQEATAQKYIDDFAAKVASAKEKLAHVEGTVAFLQIRETTAWLQGAHYLGLYYGELGLTPPDSPEAQGEGAEFSLEGLAALDPDHLFLGYFNYSDSSLPAIADQWSSTEVWKKLQAVANNQTYKFDGQLAFGFGPIGKSHGIDEIVKALE